MNDLTDIDKKTLNEFYTEALRIYGSYDSRAVRWSNFFSQNVRFKTFLEIGDLENKSLLDVGCGLGDFYFYLKSNINNFSYVGIDILEDFIKEARKKYPDGKFETIEVKGLETNYDYAFASGVFSLRIEDYETKYTELIKEIYSKVNLGFAFNLLKKGMHVEDENHVTYDVVEITNLCKEFANKVEVKEGYLDYDFTIFLYK